jgi:hypothetical protein
LCGIEGGHEGVGVGVEEVLDVVEEEIEGPAPAAWVARWRRV